MRDNAGENKSKQTVEFFYSVGVRNHFSTAHEQWQSGYKFDHEISSHSLGSGGGIWFKAACAGKDACNVTYKQRLGSTPYTCMYGASQGYFKIPRIRMQGLGPPQFGKEGEG
jgi:hypothetical protein